MKEILHEYRDKNDDLVRVRESASGEIYIDSYRGNEKDHDDHERLTTKISSGDGKTSGHDKNHIPLKYDK